MKIINKSGSILSEWAFDELKTKLNNFGCLSDIYLIKEYEDTIVARVILDINIDSVKVMTIDILSFNITKAGNIVNIAKIDDPIQIKYMKESDVDRFIDKILMFFRSPIYYKFITEEDRFIFTFSYNTAVKYAMDESIGVY